MPTKLLALDQATRTTGYSVLEDERLVKVNHFTLDNPDMGVRLHQFKKKIIQLIQENQINQVAFENIMLQAGVKENAQTFKKLAEIYGVLEELCTDLQLPYQVFYPTEWKATFGIAGKGRNIEKQQAQKYILDNYGLKCTQDEADAACIGLHASKKMDYNWA